VPAFLNGLLNCPVFLLDNRSMNDIDNLDELRRALYVYTLNGNKNDLKPGTLKRLRADLIKACTLVAHTNEP